jgi:hypothetical protein
MDLKSTDRSHLLCQLGDAAEATEFALMLMVKRSRSHNCVNKASVTKTNEKDKSG